MTAVSEATCIADDGPPSTRNRQPSFRPAARATLIAYIVWYRRLWRLRGQAAARRQPLGMAHERQYQPWANRKKAPRQSSVETCPRTRSAKILHPPAPQIQRKSRFRRQIAVLCRKIALFQLLETQIRYLADQPNFSPDQRIKAEITIE